MPAKLFHRSFCVAVYRPWLFGRAIRSRRYIADDVIFDDAGGCRLIDFIDEPVRAMPLGVRIVKAFAPGTWYDLVETTGTADERRPA